MEQQNYASFPLSQTESISVEVRRRARLACGCVCQREPSALILGESGLEEGNPPSQNTELFRLTTDTDHRQLTYPPERVIDFAGSKPTLPNGGEEFYQERHKMVFRGQLGGNSEAVAG